MIISRTPLRMSFVGGGSDLPSFYRKFGGAVVSTAIDKYVYVTVNLKFDHRIRVSYSETEEADNVQCIRHPLVRESMRLLGVAGGIEITSIADIPSRGSGLGYTVEHYQGQDPEGFINYTPRSFDLDVLIYDGEVVVAEIKSNASGPDVTEFHRSVLLYERPTGRKATKRILLAVTLQEAAWERARELGVILATDFAPLRERN